MDLATLFLGLIAGLMVVGLAQLKGTTNEVASSLKRIEDAIKDRDYVAHEVEKEIQQQMKDEWAACARDLEEIDKRYETRPQLDPMFGSDAWEADTLARVQKLAKEWGWPLDVAWWDTTEDGTVYRGVPVDEHIAFMLAALVSAEKDLEKAEREWDRLKVSELAHRKMRNPNLESWAQYERGAREADEKVAALRKKIPEARAELRKAYAEARNEHQVLAAG